MPSKKQILEQRCVQYCKQLGVNIIPNIIWTKKELKMQDPMVVGKRHGKFTLGTCFYRANFIYINYSKHGGLRELDDTLRHELIHFRFPNANHGKYFDRKIKELKNGKTWPLFDRIGYVQEEIRGYVNCMFRNLFNKAERELVA